MSSSECSWLDNVKDKERESVCVCVREKRERERERDRKQSWFVTFCLMSKVMASNVQMRWMSRYVEGRFKTKKAR